MRKLLSLCLALALLCSMASLAAAEEKTYDTTVKVSLAALEDVKDEYMATAFHQYFIEKYNIDWDYYYVEWNSWDEKLRVWINSGDLPDVAVWNYNHGDAMNYIDQGLLYQLPADWKERWPNIASAYAMTGLGDYLEQLTGGTYVLPRPVYVQNAPADPLVNQIGTLAIRKDWAEAVGFPLQDGYTVNEILEFARLVKEQDPGKVGAALMPLGFDPSNALTDIVTANSTHSRVESAFYRGEDGAWKWGPGETETLEALKIYQQAYQNGLLHPEFYTLTDAEQKESFYVSGKSAVINLPGLASFRQDCDTEMRANLGLESDDVVHTAIILGNDGKHHNLEQVNFWSSLIFSADISTESFERIMDLIDYTCTVDGQRFLNMGFEGKDWQLSEDGDLVSLLPEGETMNSLYPGRFESLYILGDDFSLINPAIKKEYRDRTTELFKLKAEKGEGALSIYDWDYQLFDSKAKNQAQFDYATEYANLILQEGDLEANWNAWVESKMPLVQALLDELNAM